MSWKAMLHVVVAFSTTEVEYIVITEAVKDATWLKGMMSKLGIKQEFMIVYYDNQCCALVQTSSISGAFQAC